MMERDSLINPEVTPLLLHPARRSSLLAQGQDLFNDEKFFEAHEAWEELWLVESERDKAFVQGLILAAAHFVHLQKKNWSGAKSVALQAREKLTAYPSHRLYRELDLAPIFSAIEYNLELLEKNKREGQEWTKPQAEQTSDQAPIDFFLFPKLLGR